MKTITFITLIVLMMLSKITYTVPMCAILIAGALSAVCIAYFLYKVIQQIRDEYNRNDD